MQIDIYGKENCTFCDKAATLAQKIAMQENGMTWQLLKLDEDYTADDLFAKAPSAKTFPQIFVDDRLIGGFHQFLGWSQERQW